MTDRGILLIQEDTPEGRRRVELLEDAGYRVVVADSQDLYWPKFIENGQWQAILFDSSSFSMIFVELASELGSAVASRGISILLIVSGKMAPEQLPSSLREAKQITSEKELLVALAEIDQSI